jgi:2-haloacid dehalogenase
LTEKYLGIQRNEIAFVSSNGWDVAGGKAFGFNAYWINRQNAPLEVLGFQPDGVIHSAMELPSIVA